MHRAARSAATAAAALLAAACTATPVPDGEPVVPSSPPPAPPAACLLDLAVLDAATGLRWTADATTASDVRCVYDTAPPGGAFLAVELTAPAAPAAELDALTGLCSGDRAPVAAGEGAFACRLADGGVIAARSAGAQLLTVTASAVPAGTTADALTRALADQLPRLAT